MLTSNAAMSAVGHLYDFVSNCANKKHPEVKVVPSPVILRNQSRPQNVAMPKSEEVLGTDVLRTSIEKYLTSPDLVQFTSVNRCINKNRRIQEIVEQRINQKWVRLSDLQEIFDAFVLQKKNVFHFNQVLSSLPQLKKINILDFSSLKPDKPLAETKWLKVKRLFKKDSNQLVTDQVLTAILERSPNLTFIDLKNCKISNVALMTIPLYCPNVQFIYGISSSVKEILFEQCPNLRRVS